MPGKLTHVDEAGRARMVDVGAKPVQLRIARAAGVIALSAETMRQIRHNEMKKGDVLSVAQVAGIMAAKRCAELIPLCHPLLLDRIGVELRLRDDGIEAESEIRCRGRTGAEMEALTAVTVALLTVYDMCKATDSGMRIGEITLLAKEKHDVDPG